jgi:hypothetical protein
MSANVWKINLHDRLCSIPWLSTCSGLNGFNREHSFLPPFSSASGIGDGIKCRAIHLSNRWVIYGLTAGWVGIVHSLEGLLLEGYPAVALSV